MAKTKKTKLVEPVVEEPKAEEPKDKRSENQKIWDAYKAQNPEKAAYKEKLFAEGLAPNSILSKLNN